MTHRASILAENNDFENLTPDGDVYKTATGKTVPLVSAIHADEIVYHQKHGFHASCIICRDEHVPVDLLTMQVRLAELEDAWAEEIDDATAAAIFAEMADLQAEIEKLNGAMDDYGEARREATVFQKSL